MFPAVSVTVRRMLEAFDPGMGKAPQLASGRVGESAPSRARPSHCSVGPQELDEVQGLGSMFRWLPWTTTAKNELEPGISYRGMGKSFLKQLSEYQAGLRCGEMELCCARQRERLQCRSRKENDRAYP